MPSVLITGSNRGIGLEFIKQFASKGWDCIATLRNKGKIEELLNVSRNYPGKISIEEMDVLDHKSIDNLAQKFKHKEIDMIINNAGILGPRFSDSSSQFFGSMDYDYWDLVHKTNTVAPFKIVEAFFKSLEKSKQKKIVIISSTVGSNIEMQAPIFSYASSKAATNKVFTLLSNVLKDKGYNIYIFCPGNVKTRMGGQNASVNVKESVEGMISLILNLKSYQTGNFFRYNGEKVQF